MGKPLHLTMGPLSYGSCNHLDWGHHSRILAPTIFLKTTIWGGPCIGGWMTVSDATSPPREDFGWRMMACGGLIGPLTYLIASVG
jgi:hypothetical protein